MNQRFLFFLASLCLFFSLSLSAQNLVITYQNSDALYVCGTDSFFVKVQNVGNTLVTGAALTIDLPTGITYLAGTVTGASEQNITDLQHPVYALPDIPAGATASIRVILTADCAAAAALDAGQLFVANLKVVSAVGTAQISTTPIHVETALLLIDSVQNSLMSGEKGDTLYRKIWLKNTRLGKISTLHFEDKHLPGIAATILSGAQSQTSDSVSLHATFDGAFFSGFGNGNGLLELGEIIMFTERIIITDCGSPEFTDPSMLKVSWGCGGSDCRTDSQLVSIQIKKSTKIPNLVFTPIWAPPLDNCETEAAIIGMKIVNTGKADANDVLLHILQAIIVGVTNYSGIGPGTIRTVHAGTTTPLVPLSYSVFHFPDCGQDLQNDVSVIVPKVPHSDSLYVYFNSLTCAPACTQDLPSYQVQYYYKKPCPVNGFVSDTFNITADFDYFLQDHIELHFGVCMQQGQEYPVLYAIKSKRLVQPYGFLRLDFNLSHGLYWPADCPKKLGNASPIKIDSVANPGDHSTTISLTYKLPLSSDTVTLPFCLAFKCDSMIFCESDTSFNDIGGVIHAGDCGFNPCELGFTYNTNWLYHQNTTQPCAISTCGKVDLAVAIPPGCSPGGDSPPSDTLKDDSPTGKNAKYSWKLRTYRTNFGLQDANDDRYADGTGTATGPGVRKDRFLPGDTMRVEYCGSVDSGGGINGIPRVIYHEILRSDMGSGGNDVFVAQIARSIFTNASNFKYLRDSMRVKYANGTQFTCPINDLSGFVDQKYYAIHQVNDLPILIIDELVTMHHRFYISLDTLFKQGCLPKPTLDKGDSIFFFTDFKLDFNFTASSNNNPDPPLVGFRTAVRHIESPFAWNTTTHFVKSQYSGYKITYGLNAFSIKPCENSIEVKPFKYRLRIARANMFPYEVRPLGQIVDYHESVPSGVTATSAKLKYLVMQDSVVILHDSTLAFANLPGKLTVDFAPVFGRPIDEGFSLAADFVFAPSCTFAKPDSSWEYWSVKFPMCFSHPQTVSYTKLNKLGFYSNHPEIKLSSPDTTFYIDKRNFAIHLTMNNPVVSTAPGVWLSAISPSGQAYNFDLLTLPQQQTITGVNGIFNLNNFQGLESQDLLLRGKDNYCKDDTLMLIYGWGCSPMTSLSQSGCYRDTIKIRLVQVEPEMELAILQQPASITLCDTSSYYEFEVFNAKKGFAYDLLTTAALPPGLQIVPGSCQLAYPGNNAYVNIADPQLLPNNIYQWNINTLLPPLATNGLPGNDLQPQNTIKIRFKVIAQCGFVANTQPVFGVRGTEPCGRPTNVLNKPGDPIKVQGLSSAYGVVISIQPVTNQPVSCGGTQQFTVKLTLLGSPSPGDSVYVIMPPGATFVTGSYLPGVNAPAGPPNLQPNGFRIPLPAVAGGSNLEFKFTASFSYLAGCDNSFVVAQTRVRSQAFCQTLGAPCTVFVATGEAATALNIVHPDLKITASTITVSGSHASASVTIQNTGTIASNGQTVQIWQDVDGSGTITTGDIQLQTLTGTQLLDPGALTTLIGNLNVSPSALCQLLLYLPAGSNCACSDQVVPVHNYVYQHDTTTICLIQKIPVGVTGQPGFAYQWSPPTGIACPTCSTTTYLPDGSQPGVPVILTLTETSSTCTIQHYFGFVVSPPVSVLASNAVICEGKPVSFSVFPNGATYHWQGPGITNPGAQSQTVTPGASANYHVTVTLSNHCVIDTSVSIKVLPADTITLATLVTCKGHPVDVLGHTTEVAGTYTHLLTNHYGCDSLVVQSLNVLPNPTTTETKTFCKGDTLHIADTLFTTSGQICRKYTTTYGCDSTHCITVTALNPPVVPVSDTIQGKVHTQIQITGPNGFTTYVWVPSDSLCPHCPSFPVTFDSAGIYKYIVTVTDQNGCEARSTIYVHVFAACNSTLVHIPNAFTPNGDGLNDVFKAVVTGGAPEVTGSIIIYDRWGVKVFENKGKIEWDGKVNGVEVPSEVYFYLIEIDCGETKDKIRGDVTVLR